MNTATAAEPLKTTTLRAIVNREELVDALAAIVPVTKSGKVRPVLRSVRIATSDDGRALLLEGTNLETRIRRRIEKVQIDAVGQSLPNCEDLLAVARLADGLTVELQSVSGEDLHVVAPSTKWELVTQKASDYPQRWETPDDLEGEFTVDAKALAAAVGFSVRAADEVGSSRYAFTSLCVRCDKSGRVDVEATDGRRAHRATFRAASNDKRALAALMTQEAVGGAARTFAAGEGDVAVAIHRTVIRLEQGATTVWATLVNGSFPPIDDVMPKDCEGSMEFDRHELATAIRRVKMMTTEESKGVRLVATPGQGIALSARKPAGGTAETRMACKVEGKAIEIGLNPAFLLDALAGMESDTIKLGWIAPNRPVKVTAGDMTAVIMPVNLQ